MADEFTPVLSPSYNQGYPSPILINSQDLPIQEAPFPILFPMAEPGYNEDYPIVANIEASTLPIQEAPFPKILPTVESGYNENYPIIANIEASTLPIQEAPFPKILPTVEPNVNEDYPVIGDVDAPAILAQEKPYPKILPTLDYVDNLEGYPYCRAELLGFFGAFCNVESLIKIKIPKSVKYIADYALWNTGITSAKISRDCIVNEHSFPPGCIIEYYDD
jgi:hypothetical protein